MQLMMQQLLSLMMVVTPLLTMMIDMLPVLPILWVVHLAIDRHTKCIIRMRYRRRLLQHTRSEGPINPSAPFSSNLSLFIIIMMNEQAVMVQSEEDTFDGEYWSLNYALLSYHVATHPSYPTRGLMLPIVVSIYMN
jgi:hypothetical protein